MLNPQAGYKIKGFEERPIFGFVICGGPDTSGDLVQNFALHITEHYGKGALSGISPGSTIDEGYQSMRLSDTRIVHS